MQKQYALNKHLTFIIPCSLLFVPLFASSTVSQSLKVPPILQPKGKIMKRHIRNPAKHLRWSFLQK